MSLVFSMTIAAAFVAGCFHFWSQLPNAENKLVLPPFRNWVVKGIALPVLLWILFNAGLSARLPPLMPGVAVALSGGGWFRVMLDVAAIGFLVVGSYWSMVTHGWMLVVISSRTQDRREFFVYSIFWSLFLGPIAWLIVYLLGWNCAGLAGTLWLAPIVLGTLEMVAPPKTPALYSRAIAKIQAGKYEDAEAAVIHELEKCENDFNGWMMLAELYATRFNDLAGADRTVRETCDQPNANVSQICSALHRLADWHLQLGENPAAARRALEEIGKRFPNTHLDRMARMRLARLPANREELIEQRIPKTFRLPALGSSFDQPASNGEPASSPENAAAEANRCVEKLKQNPDNISAREELARIFAERLDQVDLALEQMELLLGMPEQPEQKTAEWLGLIAAWQIRFKNDEPAARKTLERLLREYPQTAQAFAAQRRLCLMDAELKMRQARAKVI